MIIVRMRGGLGNQLFQYCFGYALSKEFDQELYFDLSFYRNQPSNVGKREIEITKFNIPEYKEYLPSTAVSLLTNRYIGAITRKLPTRYIKISKELYYFKEPERTFVDCIECKDNAYYDGYWQSSKYFSKYRQDILEQISLANMDRKDIANIASVLKASNSVAIHIRKGDFGKGRIRKVGHILEPDYYIRAVDICKEKIDSPVFYVFTDDKDWATSILGKKSDLRYMNDLLRTNSSEDLLLISSARNGIMSASTFSWWGNWLRNNDGLVIAPSGNYYNDYFFEEEWIQA